MRFFLTILFLLLFFFISAPLKAANAQIFKLELANPGQSISVNDSFQVKIMINTAGVEVMSGDAVINFDESKVAIDSGQNGGFLTYFVAIPLGGTNNKYLVSANEESIAHAKTAATDTLFATLSLTAKASGGTSLSFDCTPGTGADSNISRAEDNEDIINCDGLNTLTLTIGGQDAGPSSTPVPTATTPPSSPTATPIPPTAAPVAPTNTSSIPTSPPQPQAEELPRAGIIDSTIAFLSLGTLLTIIGLLVML